MQLEDPRIRYRQLQNERASNESIPMQVCCNIVIEVVFYVASATFMFDNSIRIKHVM